MALTETRAESFVETTPKGSTLRSIKSTNSLASIKSLGDIPFVESSFDLEFDTILGPHNNVTASIFSTPRYSRHNTASSIPQSIDSSWCKNAASPKKRDSTQEIHDKHERGSSDPFSNDIALPRQSPIPKEDARASPGEVPAPIPDENPVPAVPAPVSADTEQADMVDKIAKACGAIASMNEYIGTWAPTAHYVVVAAAALQRDAAAFASTLLGLLSTNAVIDPNYFANQYYQLREAYSSLLSMGDFSTVVYGQQGWTRASAGGSSTSHLAPPKDAKNETSWDDRQLLDSFVTLLRTAPGFLASAIMQMDESCLAAFCAQDDGSALNVLFHAVLGSAHNDRAGVLAETLRSLQNDHYKHNKLAGAILERILEQAVGSLSSSACTKLERFIQQILSQDDAVPDFEPVLAACVHNEFITFVREIQRDSWGLMEKLCFERLSQFARRLIMFPHQFGILTTTYISERQRMYLERIAINVIPQALDGFITQIRPEEPSPKSPDHVWWQPGELIVLKGSDIVLLYNSLLPGQERFTYTQSPSSPSSSSNSSKDEDEWCLDSIRTDLVPVMQGLAHTTTTKSDGWQIFKVGSDGLISDLGSDMGLKNGETDDGLDPKVFALCEAVARYDYPTVEERINAAREDAYLRRDHCSVLYLQGTESKISKKHVDAMESHVEELKTKCRYLRNTLEQAAGDQRRERERLSKLLAVLDCARVYVWYECEVRTGTPYYRSREFLSLLYPHCGEEDDEKLSERSLSGDNLNSAGGYSSSQSGSGTGRSRRLSILSSHSVPESPFYHKDVFPSSKLSDKEVEAVAMFMRRNRIRNIIPAEEKFHRALVEISHLSRKLIERDHIVSNVMFKRDRHYQTQHSHHQTNTKQFNNNRNSYHRRSSIGLFDFFDSVSYHGNQQKVPLTLHTTTSTQFLGLATSHDSLKNTMSSTLRTLDNSYASNNTSNVGPPRSPSLSDVHALVLSDIGRGIMAHGTETDAYMRLTGCMLLEGDGLAYQPLLDDISLASDPLDKLDALERLHHYVKCWIQSKFGIGHVSRADVVHDLSKKLGREPGTLYRDLQVIAALVNPARLDRSSAFEDCCSAARTVLDTVVIRSMDYATRFMRYYNESTTNAVPKMAIMGINDSVSIWEFCAKQGDSRAQQKLANLYLSYPHLKLEIRPLSRPSLVLEGVDANGVREAVASHWMSLSAQI